MIDLRLGDCLEAMRALPADSIDTCITDPPYALEFMGKGWDKVLPSVEVWGEVLRVLKPGAMLMAFGGTRTFHRLTTSIEDAGFEIRDCMMWLYGQGFPKSLDISKAIDKAAGAEREKIPARGGLHNNRNLNDDNWSKIGRADATMDSDAPATDAARTWDGYGTALKPAWEPIILAMKPLDGTFAENAQELGVAGLNIDAGRISTNGEVVHAPQSDPSRREGVVGTDLGISRSSREEFNAAQRLSVERTNSLGRWPANVLLDECAAAMLGEPSRFFYTAKASRGERDAGLEEMPLVTGSETTGRKEGSAGLVGDKNNKGQTANPYANGAPVSRNFHPTVKPLALMEYLCKLTRTPTGGIVLDPFMGSGTTGLACVNTGRSFIGIEIDAGYFAIAEKRIPHDAPCDVHALRSAGMSLPEIAREVHLSVPEVARMLRG